MKKEKKTMPANVGNYTSKSTIRPEFTGIYVEPGKITATDTFRCIEVFVLGEQVITDAPCVVVLPKSVKSFDRIQVQDGKAHIDAKGARYDAHMIRDVQYPKIESIVPTSEPLASLVFNAEFLLDVAKTFASLGGQLPTVTVEIYGSSKPTVFKSLDGNVRVLLMDINQK